MVESSKVRVHFFLVQKTVWGEIECTGQGLWTTTLNVIVVVVIMKSELM